MDTKSTRSEDKDSSPMSGLQVFHPEWESSLKTFSEMDQEPDLSEAWCQGHYGTKAEADAIVADIEKLAALEGTPAPTARVEHDRQGGWNFTGGQIKPNE